MRPHFHTISCCSSSRYFFLSSEVDKQSFLLLADNHKKSNYLRNIPGDDARQQILSWEESNDFETYLAKILYYRKIMYYHPNLGLTWWILLLNPNFDNRRSVKQESGQTTISQFATLKPVQ